MWKVYEYIDHRGKREITDWDLQVREMAKLWDKLNLLQTAGPDLPPGLLPGLGDSIFKLRVRGKVELRPILCKGPIDEDGEFTVLVRAIEKDFKLIPEDAIERAKARREEVRKNPNERRAEWDAT